MNVKNWKLQKVLPWILIIGGIAATYCAFILTLDKFKIAENPNFIPSCNINPIIACGNVMQSSQAKAFGFPNPFLGLIGYSVVITIGVTILAGGKFKRWFWLAVNTGLLLATIFLSWLFVQSLYQIHALCPYCLGVDAVTIPMLWYVTLYNIDQKYIRLPKGKAQKAYGWVRRHHLDILILFFLIIVAWILKHFWYYYGKHL